MIFNLAPGVGDLCSFYDHRILFELGKKCLPRWSAHAQLKDFLGLSECSLQIML